MSIGDLVAAVALIGAAVGCSAAPGGVMAGRPQQVQCSATGAGLVTPAMTPDAICARFADAIGAAAVPGETLSVDLTFLPNGVATAIVTRIRGGKAQPPVDYNLAVSDRGFGVADLDRLAADVVAGLRKTG